MSKPTAEVIHDIRSSLQIIQSNAEVVTDVVLPLPVRERLQAIQVEVRNIAVYLSTLQGL